MSLLPTDNAVSRAEAIAQCCDKATATSAGDWQACCPAHDDTHPSLTIKAVSDRVLVYCHAGCPTETVVASLGLGMRDLFLAAESYKGKRIEATYDYHDANGTLVHQTVRLEGKQFLQRRPDPAKPDTWLWNLKGIETVVYRLPELRAAMQRNELVHVVEGEKDANALAALGLTATCNPMGAKKWRKHYTDAFRGARVAILPDNDEPGAQHAAFVAKALHGLAAEVKIVSGVHTDAVGSDVSDWLAADHTAADLVALVDAAPAYTPETASPASNEPASKRQGQQQTQEQTRDTSDCPYENTPSGIVRHSQRDKEMVTTRLTNFTAEILANVVEDDGVETHLLFEIGARLNDYAPTFTIPASHFTGMGWVTEHMGASAIVMPGMGLKDHARAAIQMLSHGIADRHIYKHIGWRELATGWAYLHAGGAIGSGGSLADVTVDPGAALAPFVLCMPETREAKQVALLSSMYMLTVAPPAITVPLYGALWRALLGICDLSVHITGRSGVGKSVLAALVQQHLGQAMDAKGLPASWTSTANALEALAFQAKDAILVVDDFCPRGSPSEVAQLHGKADRLFRAQGNRSARQRLDRTGRDRPAKPPRGLVVSTGEDIPAGQSLRARICILEVTPDTINWSRLTPCQSDAATGVYTQALAAFVQWLAPHYGEVTATLPQDLITLRAAAVQTAHRRTPELIANLALGWRYFLACAHELGVLTDDECQRVWAWAWRTLSEVAVAQQDHQTEDDPVARFLALLRAAITAGQAHVLDASTFSYPLDAHEWGWMVRETTRPGDEHQEWTPHGSCVGYLDEDRLYLEPEASYVVVQRMAEAQRAPLAITQRTLHKRMAEQELIIRQTGQNAMLKRLGPAKKRHRVLSLAVSSLVPCYSEKTSDSSDSSDEETQDKQNQHVVLSLVPPLRAAESVTGSKKSVTSEAPVSAAKNLVTDSVTDSARVVTDFFSDLSLQLVEKKEWLLMSLESLLVSDTEGTREIFDV